MQRDTFKAVGTVVLGALIVALLGCDGISGTGGPSRSGDDTAKQTPQSGQAVLGPIIGASVTIRDVEDIDAVACSTTTSDNDDLTQAGTISFNQPCIFADHLYLVTVTGGKDIDYDDNGMRDATPTDNTGEFRALLGGDQLLQNNWKTNVLTESVYQAVQYAIQLGDTDIAAKVDQIAQQLIRQDLNGDNIIDRRDIALWHPVDHATSAINNAKLRFSTGLIHQNLNRTLTEIPDAEALAGHIDTLAPARQVLMHDNDILVTTDTALLIYRYDNGEAELLSSTALGWIYDMAVAEDSVYVALGENGVAEIDITDGARPQELQRWQTPAERITTLQDRILFSYYDDVNQYTLAEIVGPSVEIITTTSTSFNMNTGSSVRRYSDDQAVHSSLLKTAGNTVYWAPLGEVQRFILQDNAWHPLSTVQTDGVPTLNIIDDIEIFADTLYVVYRASEPSINLWALLASPEFYTATVANQFDVVLPFLERRVDIVNISNPETPVLSSTYVHDDIEAIRRWDNNIVALGGHDISIRYAGDLRSKLSVRLPETFSGFYPAKGIVRAADVLIVAAKENGVLLLSSKIPIKRHYGIAYADGLIANSRIVVKRRPENSVSCELQGDALGIIGIPESCITNAGYYDISVIGGERIRDGEASPFSGTLHATIHSEAIMQSGWFVSPLTEIAWRAFEYSTPRDASAIEFAYGYFFDWLLERQSSAGNTLNTTLFATWNPIANTSQLKISSEQWQLALNAMNTGTWSPQTSASLFAPYAKSHFFDEYITKVVATSDLVFVAQNSRIDVFTTDAQMQWVKTLPQGADEMYAYGDTVVAIDGRTNNLKLYRTDAAGGVTLVRDIVDAGTIDLDSSFCATTDTLFGINSRQGNNGWQTYVNAWRIVESGLQHIDSIPLSLEDSPLSLHCDENTFVIAADHNIDIVKLASDRLARTDSTASRFINDVLFAGTQIYLSTTSTTAAGQRLIYALDADGHLTLTQTIIQPLKQERKLSGYIDIGNTTWLAATRWDDIAFIDNSTQQYVAELFLPSSQNAKLLAGKQTVWLWAGTAIWSIDAAKVLTGEN